MRISWKDHIKIKRFDHDWAERTIRFFRDNSGFNFKTYKNVKGDICFVSLTKPYWKGEGYEATIIFANELQFFGTTVGSVSTDLMARSFYLFDTIEQFKNQYSKIDLAKYEHGIEFYK